MCLFLYLPSFLGDVRDAMVNDKTGVMEVRVAVDDREKKKPW